MERGEERAHEAVHAHVRPSSGPPTVGSSAAMSNNSAKKGKNQRTPPQRRTDPTFGRFRVDHEIHAERRSN